VDRWLESSIGPWGLVVRFVQGLVEWRRESAHGVFVMLHKNGSRCVAKQLFRQMHFIMDVVRSSCYSNHKYTTVFLISVSGGFSFVMLRSCWSKMLFATRRSNLCLKARLRHTLAAKTLSHLSYTLDLP
jgi:hypothetical protein